MWNWDCTICFHSVLVEIRWKIAFNYHHFHIFLSSFSLTAHTTDHFYFASYFFILILFYSFHFCFLFKSLFSYLKLFSRVRADIILLYAHITISLLYFYFFSLFFSTFLVPTIFNLLGLHEIFSIIHTMGKQKEERTRRQKVMMEQNKGKKERRKLWDAKDILYKYTFMYVRIVREHTISYPFQLLWHFFYHEKHFFSCEIFLLCFFSFFFFSIPRFFFNLESTWL